MVFEGRERSGQEKGPAASVAARLGMGGRPRAIGRGKPRSIPVRLCGFAGHLARNRFAGTVVCAPPGNCRVAAAAWPGKGAHPSHAEKDCCVRALQFYGRVYSDPEREAIPCSSRSVLLRSAPLDCDIRRSVLPQLRCPFRWPPPRRAGSVRPLPCVGVYRHRLSPGSVAAQPPPSTSNSLPSGSAITTQPPGVA
jgi:hypothetical protein